MSLPEPIKRGFTAEIVRVFITSKLSSLLLIASLLAGVAALLLSGVGFSALGQMVSGTSIPEFGATFGLAAKGAPEPGFTSANPLESSMMAARPRYNARPTSRRIKSRIDRQLFPSGFVCMVFPIFLRW